MNTSSLRRSAALGIAAIAVLFASQTPALAAGAAAPPPVPPATTVPAPVFHDAFDRADLDPAWGDGRLTTSPSGEQFLGEYGATGDTAVPSLTLTNLPDHSALRVTFDLYVLRGATGSPFVVTDDAGHQLVNVRPANEPRSGDCTAAAPDGAAERNTLGYVVEADECSVSERPMDSTYHLVGTLLHTAASVTFTFTGDEWGDAPEGAAWGIDNVNVDALGDAGSGVSCESGTQSRIAFGLWPATVRGAVNSVQVDTPNTTSTCAQRDAIKTLDVVGTSGDDVLTFDESWFARDVPRVRLALGAGNDRVIIQGTANADRVAIGATSIDLNKDGKADITFEDSNPTITVLAGDGNDIVSALGNAATGLGNARPVRLFGEAGNDILTGGAGEDFLDGGAGNDRLAGSQGNDTEVGDVGDDTLDQDTIRNGADRLLGGLGTDLITYANRADSVVVIVDTHEVTGGPAGGPEPDVFSELENITTGAGDDFVLADGDARAIFTGAGADSILSDVTIEDAPTTAAASGGSNVIDSGDDTDTVLVDVAGPVRVKTSTGSGNDFAIVDVVGPVRVDTSTGSGDDFVLVDTSPDATSVIDLGEGNDFLLNDGAARIDGGVGNDTIYGGDGVQRIYGGAGDDELHGGEANDIVSGDEGNDTIVSDPLVDGNDTYDGGEGTDVVSYADRTASVRLAAESIGNGDVASREKDAIRNIETLTAGSGDDTVTGTDRNDKLDGGPGNDKLYGLGGADTIHGGPGNDTLDGGDGNDKLYGNGGNDSFFGGPGKNMCVAGSNGTPTFDRCS